MLMIIMIINEFDLSPVFHKNYAISWFYVVSEKSVCWQEGNNLTGVNHENTGGRGGGVLVMA